MEVQVQIMLKSDPDSGAGLAEVCGRAGRQAGCPLGQDFCCTSRWHSLSSRNLSLFAEGRHPTG